MLRELTAADIAAGAMNEPAAPGPVAFVQHHHLLDVVAVVEVQLPALQGQQIPIATFPALERVLSIAGLQKEGCLTLCRFGGHAEL